MSPKQVLWCHFEGNDLVGAQRHETLERQGKAYPAVAPTIRPFFYTLVSTQLLGSMLRSYAPIERKPYDGFNPVSLALPGNSRRVAFKNHYLISAAAPREELEDSIGWAKTRESILAGGADSVSGAGDVNHDGISDIIIGDTNFTGSTHVIFGHSGASELTGTVDVGDIGTTVEGDSFFGTGSEEQFGYSVSDAGDVNGDGIDDLLIGSPVDFLGGGPTRAYLVYGQDEALGPIDLQIDATFSRSFSRTVGRSVSGTGDFNGDGLADFIIGDPIDGNRSYLVYGKAGASELTRTFDLRDTGTSLDGVLFQGPHDPDIGEGTAGWSVSNAGDVNGDGIDDLLIGATFATPPGGTSMGLGAAGMVYLYLWQERYGSSFRNDRPRKFYHRF